MKKLLLIVLVFGGLIVNGQTLKERRAAAKKAIVNSNAGQKASNTANAVKNKVGNTANAAKTKVGNTYVGEKLSTAIVNRPKPIETVKELAEYIQNEFKDMKNDRVGILEQYNNFKEKTGFLSGDFFSPDLLDNLKDGMSDAKERITAEAAAIKSFAGADRKGSPGTECYKFKNSIQGLINNIESLKGSLLGDVGGKANVDEKLGDLIQKLPPASVYPMYRIMGSMLSALNQKATDLSQSVKYLVEANNEMAMITPASLNNSLYIRTAGPFINNNGAYGYKVSTNQGSMPVPGNIYQYASFTAKPNLPELSKIGNINRDRIEKAIAIVRDTKPVWIFASKMLQESKGKDVEIGGSFFGHFAFHITVKPGQKIGLIMEAVTEQVDQLLDHWSNYLDQLDQNDLTATLKRIEDNQNKILQKLGL